MPEGDCDVVDAGRKKLKQWHTKENRENILKMKVFSNQNAGIQLHKQYTQVPVNLYFITSFSGSLLMCTIVKI